MERLGAFVARLLDGGTFEIVLLVGLVLVGLVVAVLVLWVVWKLLVVLGRGVLWVARWGSGTLKARAAAQRDAAAARPPAVATGWGTSGGRLRPALAEARRRAGRDAVCVVVVAGHGMGELCRSLGLARPGVGVVGVAAGPGTVLIDASATPVQGLGRVARALPWRRPTDAVAVLLDEGGLGDDAVARAARFAQAARLRVALHLVVPHAAALSAWRVVDASVDSDAVCAQLAADTARRWLLGGSREGLETLALSSSKTLAAALARALTVAPSAVVDVASLAFGGAGLRAAVMRTRARTCPLAAPGPALAGAGVACVGGAAMAVVAGFGAVDHAQALRADVDGAAREARVSWEADGVNTVPSAARVRRVAGLAVRLSDHADLSAASPLSVLVPRASAPERLGGAFLEAYVLRPLGRALQWRARRRLEPSADPDAWLDDARVVGEWTAAWEGLATHPSEVDVQRLLVAGFGGTKSAWPSGVDQALAETGVVVPLPEDGGLDVDAVRALARQHFIATMQRWADGVYTHGPVASAARQAADPSAPWRVQHQALTALRNALQDPTQQWLTAAEDRPDHSIELGYLGRALGLSLIGQATTLEAKAAVSRIRIDARAQAPLYSLEVLGPLLVRSGASSGPSLSMAAPAAAWLAFLDQIAAAGLDAPPQRALKPFAGVATIDVDAVTAAHDRLQAFDQLASTLPAEVPPALAQSLLRNLANELVLGVVRAVELALRPATDTGLASERAQRRASAAAATVEDLQAIEAWLWTRQASDAADTVLAARARVGEGVLEAASAVLDEEDPLGVFLDPSADRDALLRRFERGVGRFTRVYEQLAKPFLQATVFGQGWAVLHWSDMAEDIEAYARGDAASTLSALEGMVRAYVEDPHRVCDIPRPLVARGDYLALGVSRFAHDLDQHCAAVALAHAHTLYDPVEDYFQRHVAGLWPYAHSPHAPELPPAALAELATLMHQAIDAYPLVHSPLATALAHHARFWELADGVPVVRLRIQWRAHRTLEHLAQHVAEVDVEGLDPGPDGLYTWRYGTPFTLRMRLASHSPYRFVLPDGRRSDVWRSQAQGNGALLRLLEDVTKGVLLLHATVTRDSDQPPEPLRLSAQLLDTRERPLAVPMFFNLGLDS